MIKDSIDFDYAFEQINRELSDDIKPQKKILKSEDFNTTLNTIENNLNTLYENARNLENMIAYCKTFLSIKIDTYTKEMDSILNLIEDTRDVNKNMTYIDYAVPFNQPYRTSWDRDGRHLPVAKIQNKMIMLSDSLTEIVHFSNCSRKNFSIPYKENLKYIKVDPYRTTYIEDGIISGGIREEITINFPNPVTMNNIVINTSNCTVENLVFKYINGTQEYQKEYGTGFVKTKVITSMSFDLVCKNYIHSSYKIDKDKMTDNTWDYIKEYEYNDLINANSQLQVDEIIEITRDKETISVNSSGSNNTITTNRYSYRFGIDDIKITNVKQYDDCCFLSDEISVGSLNEKEYINITSDYIRSQGNDVEFYIIDGTKEIPIIPIHDDFIENEKIFTGMETRFKLGSNPTTVIKKDGYIVNMSLSETVGQTDGGYSVDYYPDAEDGCYSYRPVNTSIRVKAVLRKYNDFAEMPYIKSIKIRKYGGAAPWIENL